MTAKAVQYCRKALDELKDALGALEGDLPGVDVIEVSDEDVTVDGNHPFAGKTLTYAVTVADIRAEAIDASARDSRFDLVLPGDRERIILKIPGAFMLSNALAAAAVGVKIGLAPAEIKAGLENFVPAENRMNILTTQTGIHVIDDTYNANPASVRHALDTLRAVDCSGRRIAVLGDMLELGQYERQGHDMVGIRAAETADVLITVGERGRLIAAAAREAGMNSALVTEAADTIQAAEVLRKMIGPEDVVLAISQSGETADTPAASNCRTGKSSLHTTPGRLRATIATTCTPVPQKNASSAMNTSVRSRTAGRTGVCGPG